MAGKGPLDFQAVSGPTPYHGETLDTETLNLDRGGPLEEHPSAAMAGMDHGLWTIGAKLQHQNKRTAPILAAGWSRKFG